MTEDGVYRVYTSLSLPRLIESPGTTGGGVSTDSASPTCLRSGISSGAGFLRRFRIRYRMGSVSPRGDADVDDDDKEVADDVPSTLPLPLVTANSYCRGSDELESRLRWR